MHINTTARHFELASDDRQHAHTRFEKFQRFAQDLHEIHLVVTAERYRHIAELTLRLKHRDLAIREEATDPRRAIDLVADRAEHQLRRLHERRVDRGRTRDPLAGANGTNGDGAEDDTLGDTREA